MTKDYLKFVVLTEDSRLRVYTAHTNDITAQTTITKTKTQKCT